MTIQIWIHRSCRDSGTSPARAWIDGGNPLLGVTSRHEIFRLLPVLTVGFSLIGERP